MTNGTSPPVDPELELHKLQFDYAWKWFAYHADQRVKMFNFMLIVFGVFATAIVTALGSKDLPSGVAAVLCFVAAALGLTFSLLDRRNRDLVWIGEEVLTHLEKNFILPNPNRSRVATAKTSSLGFYLVNRPKIGIE
jgi:hypothetical protein